MQRKGMLIIVSGPSGVGKGTICAELRARNPQIRESISMTTRARRNGETEGVDYFYVSEERFNELEKAERNAAYLGKLERGLEQVHAGLGIVKTMEELEAMVGDGI